MSVWPENTDKIITIIAPSDASINIDYKLRNTQDNFASTGITLAYNNNDQWEGILNLSVGEYMIRTTINSATLGREMIYHNGLSVISLDMFDLRINQNIIKDKITSANSWKTMS